MVAVVARDLRVGRVLLAGDRDGRPDLVEVGKQLLRSGALGAVADRLEARAGPGQLRTASRLLKIVDVVGDSLLKIRVSTF